MRSSQLFCLRFATTKQRLNLVVEPVGKGSAKNLGEKKASKFGV